MLSKLIRSKLSRTIKQLDFYGDGRRRFISMYARKPRVKVASGWNLNAQPKRLRSVTRTDAWLEASFTSVYPDGTVTRRFLDFGD